MGTVHCIPKLNEIDSFLRLSEEYKLAFEYNEFFSPTILSDFQKTKKIITEYKSLGRDTSKDTLHGAFYDVNIASDDPEIFSVSDKRINQSLDAARELGARAVILHTNYIANFKLASYRSGWVDRSEEYYRRLTEKNSDIFIYLENMFDPDPELLQSLCIRMQDVENFAACLDFAHAYISEAPIAKWREALSPYVGHVHINDNYGSEDLHLPVGKGTLPWNEYNDFMKKDGKDASVLIEVSSLEKLKASIEFMMSNDLYPFV